LVSDIDAELEAIKTLQAALEPLRPEVRARVLDYVFRVLDIAHSAPAVETRTAAPSFTAATAHQVTDILSLKQDKKPTSANQMIALVAYYLAHSAPDAEKKEVITAADVRKYFMQGRYPMPGSLPQALINARSAGYIDLVDKGTYRLNSVGYNLVAHKLAGEEGKTRSSPKRSKQKAKKGSRR
jgi:hypothetical protein